MLHKTPKKAFLKVYSDIYNYKLSISAFAVYLYLTSISYKDLSATVKFDRIASRCNMSVNTAQRAVKELCEKSLIKKVNRYTSIFHRTSNKYLVTVLSGTFTMIDRRIFKLGLDNSSLYTLAAIQMCQKSHSNMSFPSYSQISETTGLSRSTVISKVKVLRERGLLAKELYIRLDNKFGHNNYYSITLDLRLFLFDMILRLKSRFIKLVSKTNRKVKIILFRFKTLKNVTKFIGYIILVLIVMSPIKLNDKNTC